MATITRKKLGERIKELREDFGYSQEELAQKIKVPRPAISQIEAGVRDVSSIELANIAKVFDIATDTLLDQGVELKKYKEEQSELKKSAKGSDVRISIPQFNKDKFKNIVVGEILEVRKHPQADKLQLARVRLKNEILDIVCGAPNIAVGQKVPVALVGAVLPNGLEIKEALIRGERSSGMLCALDELGLGDDHSGIFILDKKAKLSQNLAEYLKLKDVILEVDNKSLTNRPDLWGHFGMAREISVFLGRKFKEPGAITADKNESGTAIDVRIDDHGLCPRYMAVAMDNIKIGPSPRWMQERLAAVGTRPINNIVDITNYVMLEYGQPMHAFDASLIKDQHIIVRKAGPGEKIVTLDGKEHVLEHDMLVIADPEKAIAVAGVMGAGNTEVSAATRTIILESAYFNPISIHKTSKQVKIRTDSSVRFEHGVDWNAVEEALDRAAALIAELGRGEVSRGKVDVCAKEKKAKLIELRTERVNKILGVEVPVGDIVSILTRLGFKTKKIDSRKLKIEIPLFRAMDVEREIDLIEEGDGEIRAFEFKWSKKPQSPPSQWSTSYPEATYTTIGRDNYFPFLL